MHPPLRRRAFTLAETILALFMLSGMMLFVVMLFQTMMAYQSKVEKQALCSLAAQKLVEEMREAGATPAGFANLAATYDGTSRVDPNFPAIALNASVQPFPTFTPCQGLEAPQANPKKVDSSLLLVRVNATFEGRTVQVSSLVGEPPRPMGTVQVTLLGSSNPLPGATTDLKAELLDAGGNPVPDETFRWAVIPLAGTPGNGILTLLSRDGSRVQLKNQYVQTNGAPIQFPGNCLVRATVRYHGREISGDSGTIQLQ